MVRLGLTAHQNAILSVLKRNGEMSRNNLVNELRLPRTTIFDNLKILQKKGLIRTSILTNEKRGRPIVLWEAPCKSLCSECVGYDIEFGCTIYRPVKEKTSDYNEQIELLKKGDQSWI